MAETGVPALVVPALSSFLHRLHRAPAGGERDCRWLVEEGDQAKVSPNRLLGVEEPGDQGENLLKICTRGFSDLIWIVNVANAESIRESSDPATVRCADTPAQRRDLNFLTGGAGGPPHSAQAPVIKMDELSTSVVASVFNPLKVIA